MSSSIASMRTEPESWSGVSMQASTTSTRRFAFRSRSSSACMPLLRCVASTAAPLLAERHPIHRLVALDAGVRIGAGRLALEMHDRRVRLVVHAAARGAHGERKVRILVVRGRIAVIEAAQLAEQRRRDREARAGAVVASRR